MPTLDWVNKSQALEATRAVPIHLLKQEAAYGDPDARGNLLIQGDNLLALKALLPVYAGRVKCIMIDPPYNTQSAFAHYDDKLEHSQWLSMMLPRLTLLRELLAEDGSIWVTIDDNEAHYLKVLMDQAFGRKNFVANVVWQKKSSPQSNATWLSDSHDHVLCYARIKDTWRPNKLRRSDEQNAIYNHSDDHDGIDADGNWYGRGPWFPGDFTLSLASGQRGRQFALTGESNNLYPITTPSGREVLPARGRAWAYTKDSYERLRADNRVHFGKSGNSKPTIKRFLGEIQDDGVVATTVWPYKEVGENRTAAQEVKAVSGEDAFTTPKPERLIQRILDIATNAGDLVLDSFLGSGTTAAVAHKMGRRWIGIEMGDHARTHCIPRLEKVIAGEQGGVSAAVGWQGGGGFRFCTLGEPAFDADGRINPEVKFATLASFIWHYETATPAAGKFPSPLLGVYDGTAYYLLYNGILGDLRPRGGNVLTRTVLAMLQERHPHDGPKVIYGEVTRLGDAALAAANATFKQIPYDIKAR